MNGRELRNVRLLACLGEPSRFRLIAELAARERCVTDLARAVRLSQSCTTRHLQALERAGLVEGKRDGKRVVFRVRSESPDVASLVSWALAVEVAGTPAPSIDARATADPLVVAGASLHREVESGRLAGFDTWRPKIRRESNGPRKVEPMPEVVDGDHVPIDPGPRDARQRVDNGDREPRDDIEDFLL
jgi:DNA-binding transcriptional ArsR family regulator